MADHGKAKRGIPPKADFNAWYPAIVEIAELVDKRYPIKGMDVWRPYGWKAMRCIDALTHEQMERTDHEEVRFPLLIPEDLLEKENRLVSLLKRAREEGVDPSELRHDEEDAGFKSEVYWVRHAGENDLDVPMFLRPTSETAMYTMFPLWVRSHADLPLKTYQIVNTFRYETKQTRSFIRVREIHFFEAHTAHIDEECASRQIAEDLEIVGRLMTQMSLPVIISKRPVWDTFPGAWYTIAIDVIMPNGRTLQVASCHHYRDQWAKAFDLTYQDEAGETQYCHQTTYGMSERLLGAVVSMHGDDNGLIFPPIIAPIQVVLMPVAAHKSEAVGPAVTAAADTLRSAGLRVKVDDRDLRPGQKYWDWEIKGVPLRLEIGPRDVDQGNAFAARRTGGKEPLPLDDIVAAVRAQLAQVQSELEARTRAHVADRVHSLENLEQEILDGHIYEVAFDGTDADAEVIEKQTGLTILGDAMTPFESPRPCIVTGQMTTRRQNLARMY
jgi:prolyl-tRNA synthetase